MAEATIRDVARRAQVSVASVSRALNGLANVHADTRARVLAAASELGYVPHAAARSLSLARSHAIGVVLPDLHGEFFSEFVRGMDREASSHGYMLLLSNMHASGEQAHTVLRAMRGRVDGLIVMAPHIDAGTLAQALPQSMPSVLINTAAELAAPVSIRVDNAAGIAAMVRHMVETGRRRMVHIAGPAANIDAQERAEGFRAALAEFAPDSPIDILPGDFNEEAGAAAAAIILGRGVHDAVVAANDMMAIGCLHALRAAGIRVPEEIAVGGFDDVPLARYLSLTTLQVRIAEIGARAVRSLVDRLAGRSGGSDVRELHPPELIVRATTGQADRGETDR